MGSILREIDGPIPPIKRVKDIAGGGNRQPGLPQRLELSGDLS
jgi:hypothetical protein